MPELPEVETVVRSLQKRIIGKSIINVSVLFPGITGIPDSEFENRILGHGMENVSRRGKLIIVKLDNRYSILIHLGMTGRVVLENPEAPVPKHTHVILALSPSGSLRYADVRRFGFIRTIKSGDVSQFLEKKQIGPEPLEVSRDTFCRDLSARRGGIKALLLKQSFVAGIGNIYADEILHRAGIHPLTGAHRIGAAEKKRLYKAMVDVLGEAIEQKGSSISDYVDADGNAGTFQNLHKVYGRTGQPCLTCGTHISREVVAGRGTHYCRVCQPG